MHVNHILEFTKRNNEQFGLSVVLDDRTTLRITKELLDKSLSSLEKNTRYNLYDDENSFQFEIKRVCGIATYSVRIGANSTWYNASSILLQSGARVKDVIEAILDFDSICFDDYFADLA